MPFTIHREKQPDKLIRMGQAPVYITDEELPLGRVAPRLLEREELLAEVSKVQPPPIENKQGRKKMAEEKKLSQETGVKTISQEPADKQGPVGTSQQPPPREPDQEVKIGNKEGKKNA